MCWITWARKMACFGIPPRKFEIMSNKIDNRIWSNSTLCYWPWILSAFGVKMCSQCDQVQCNQNRANDDDDEHFCRKLNLKPCKILSNFRIKSQDNLKSWVKDYYFQKSWILQKLWFEQVFTSKFNFTYLHFFHGTREKQKLWLTSAFRIGLHKSLFWKKTRRNSKSVSQFLQLHFTEFSSRHLFKSLYCCTNQEFHNMKTWSFFTIFWMVFLQSFKDDFRRSRRAWVTAVKRSIYQNRRGKEGIHILFNVRPKMFQNSKKARGKQTSWAKQLESGEKLKFSAHFVKQFLEERKVNNTLVFPWKNVSGTKLNQSGKISGVDFTKLPPTCKQYFSLANANC